MNRITKRFEDLKGRQESAFIPYITAGDPSLEQTEQIIYALEEAGSDVIELGVPFSDPVGDGPVIQAAALRALERHVNLRQIFTLVKKVRERSEVPLLLFSYFNPIFVFGYARFAEQAAAAGVDGVLCVDLPPEEADDYKAALDEHGVATVFLTAPTTSDERLELVAQQCTGFVYYVSRMGVTGEQAALATDLEEALARIKRHTDKPIAVGFGISTPDQAQKVAGLAEGVVVGSAIVRLIAEAGDSPDTAQRVHDFVKSLADAAKGRTVAAG
jgi:tryptophan synthase alpha chain